MEEATCTVSGTPGRTLTIEVTGIGLRGARRMTQKSKRLPPNVRYLATKNGISDLVRAQMALEDVPRFEKGVRLGMTANIFIQPGPEPDKNGKMINRNHAKTVDVDNILKMLLDALNKVAYWDDVQVRSYGAVHVYEGPDEFRVTFWRLADGQQA